MANLIDVDLDWVKGELEARLDPKVVEILHAVVSDVKQILGDLYADKTDEGTEDTPEAEADTGDATPALKAEPKATTRKSSYATKKDPE